MPIAKEILNMFEFNQNQNNTFTVDNHFNECALSQQRSVPTYRQTLLMHRYLQSQGLRCSVGTPLHGKSLLTCLLAFRSDKKKEQLAEYTKGNLPNGWK